MVSVASKDSHANWITDNRQKYWLKHFRKYSHMVDSWGSKKKRKEKKIKIVSLPSSVSSVCPKSASDHAAKKIAYFRCKPVGVSLLSPSLRQTGFSFSFLKNIEIGCWLLTDSTGSQKLLPQAYSCEMINILFTAKKYLNLWLHIQKLEGTEWKELPTLSVCFCQSDGISDQRSQSRERHIIHTLSPCSCVLGYSTSV